MDQLEKIDVIRERIGVSYREASEALQEAGEDLVQALIIAEEKLARGWSDRLFGKNHELVEKATTYIRKGNNTKIKLKKDDRTIAEFPATVGAFGLIAALASAQVAVVAGIGTVAAVANKVTLEIEKADGETKVISLCKHRQERES